MRLNLLLPYSGSDKFYQKWANEEAEIDFANEPERAERCTLAFAVMEMKIYLEKIGHEVSVSESRADSVNIAIKSLGKDSEEFDIVSDGFDIEIVGEGRRGALYGAYELLEAQGVRWYAPELDYVPVGAELVYPKAKHYKYAMSQGRGFHFEDLQNESQSLILWMARNRMSTHACHAHLKAFQQKLGMIFAIGGHIFEKILAPTNIAEDGRAFLDSHRDWYGKREDGEITEQNALSTQFCVSNTELCDYIAAALIRRMNREWKNEQIISIDGFDTWGKNCACKACRALGNGSDTMLKLLSHVRTRMNEATERGELRSGIRLSTCAYEGTATMPPPENPIPENLLLAGDYILYCPIMRCYEHDFREPCDRNRDYNKYLLGWLKTGINIAFLEYYNVSRFEDLPLVFTRRIVNDVRYYIEKGVKVITYMHAYAKEWGLRAINNYMLAVVSRNPECDAEMLIDEYYRNVYGEYAGEAKEIYEKIERASALSASWRAWNFHSALTAFQEWDGVSPAELDYDTHIKERVIESSEESLRLFEEALASMRKIRKSRISKLPADTFAPVKNVVNPADLEKLRSRALFLDKLNEDIRALKYGTDVYRLTHLFAKYQFAINSGEPADELISEIEKQGELMSEYTYSVVFNAYSPDFQIRDVLRRSQYKDLYYRVLTSRNKTDTN
ncbi:MAG: DUF4838 domain-containing protein [Clostridia bacterium]|nr:DUF4838 domain-containing protein [Clostridia bacterium]